MHRLISLLFLCLALWQCGASIAPEQELPSSNLNQWKLDTNTLIRASLPALSPAAWKDKLQPQIIAYYEQEVYGPLPAKGLLTASVNVREAPTPVFDGLGLRSQVALKIRGLEEQSRQLDLLIYYPATSLSHPTPVLLNLNFLGNQSIVPDPEVYPSSNDVYTGRAAERGFVERRPTDKSRGIRSGRLPVELLLREGFAVITAGYQDVLPDQDPAARRLLQDFYGMDTTATGAISVWARAYHWLADYALQQDDFRVDSLVATGHSRLGKAVLWAAATDERITAVHVNNSGCGGATLFRRAEGETIADITHNFPHWFRDDFHAWAGRDSLITLDQEWLLASLAPRKLLVSSATKDQWADPVGEFSAARAVLPAYRSFFGDARLPQQYPLARDGHAYGLGPVRYHLRDGPHDLQQSDFAAFLMLLKE